MANNYGSLEGTMDANNTIVGAEIQFGGGSGGNGVKDVKVNGTSVVDANKIANVDLTPYAEIENVYDKQTIDTALEGKADTDDIPTELSDLTDDENHRLVTDTEKSTWDNKADESDIPTVNNPTITIQKNNQNIDSFTLNQDSNKSINITVPTKTSDLQNDNSFITNTVNNLANYYLKTQTYTQSEVDALIDAAINGRFRKVNSLPVTGEPNVIYLVPKATPETSNACDEYIWQDNAWELIGSTNIDLSGYVTDEDLGIALADYLTISAFNTAIANYYTKTEVGNLLDAKVDKVSGKGLSTNDYDNTAKGIVDGVTNALAGKVDKVNGKGLSTEDYTTTEKNKLAGISTGANKVESSTTNGNIQIDGTETQVYDDSDIQDKIDVSLESVSGNPISITGLKSSQLAVNPVITFEPIQAGSGTPSPSNIRPISGYDKIEVLSCGVNLFDGVMESGTIDSNTGLPSSSSSYMRTVNYIPVMANTEYFFKVNAHNSGLRYYDKYYNYLGYLSLSANDRNITTPADCAYVKFISNITSYSGDIGFNYPKTQTSYVPYHKTTDLSESLGQTVYWGELDLRSGKFKVLGKIVDLGDLSWQSRHTAYANVFSTESLTDYKFASDADAICSGFNYDGTVSGIASFAQKGDATICLYYSTGSSRVLYVKDSRYSTDANAFTTAVTGIKLVYEIATPFYIQLTPHEIALSQDYAYISTNGTLIALDYHNGELARLSDVAQLSETLERKVLRAEGHAYSTSEQVVGTWIDGSTIYEKSYQFNNYVTLPTNTWMAILGVSDLDIDKIIRVDMLDMEGIYWSGALFRINNGNFEGYSFEGWTVQELTIQYTKTTD